jgi:type IV secretion system protein VirB9
MIFSHFFLKKILPVLLMAGGFITSCKTIDMQPAIPAVYNKQPVPEADGGGVAVEELEFTVEPQIVFVEKPVYIPAKDAGSKAEAPLTGAESVKKSTGDGTVKPENYSHAARIYDYNPDQVYEVYAQVLRTTDIYLEPGEIALDVPFISDSERWVLGAGINQQQGQTVQHIYLKPKETGLEASMIINTDRRTYHIILRSYAAVYMPMVKWRYINNGFPLHFAGDIIKNNGITPQTADLSEELEYVDPRFVSFDYQIQFIKKPKWLPRLIYDDGKKTYIVFSEQTLQAELPGIFENRNDVINYRVSGDLAVIDKLIEKITVKYKGRHITIIKKKGQL